MTSLELILSKLTKVKRTHNGYEACCPAHDDQHPSLSITPKEDRILLHCQTGCSPEAVVEALGLTMADLFDEPLTDKKPEILETYDYTDADGKVLYQVVRMLPKSFRQRRPDGKGGYIWNMEGQERVLYHLPRVAKTIAAEGVVFVVEGEKDVHTLESWGLTATTNAGGAGKWLPSYAESLRGAKVYVLADNDEIGRAHADLVAASLKGVAEGVVVLPLPGLPEKGDVSDWARMGHTKEDLVRVIRERPKKVRTCIDVLSWVESHTHRDNPLPRGIDYPWLKVNNMTNGMHPGWLCVLAGYTSHGKTAAALEIAVTACKEGRTVLFASLEMPAETVGVRVAQRSGLNSFGFFRGCCTDSDRAAAAEAVNLSYLKRLHIVEATRSVVAITELISEIEPDLVIVDHLAKMDMGDTRDLRAAYSRTTLALVEMAKSLHVPVLLLAQLRRNVGVEAGSVPTVQDLKESSSIEQDADQVIFVWRERNAVSKVAEEKGMFIVAKSRMGMVGSEKFIFDGARQMFHAVDEPA